MQAARMVVSEWRSIVAGDEPPEPIAEYPHADEVSTGEEKAAGGHLCKDPPIRDVEYAPDADACQRCQQLGMAVYPIMDCGRRHGALEGRHSRYVKAPATA